MILLTILIGFGSALMIKQTHTTRGINVIEIDLNNYDEFTIGQSTLVISLTYNSIISYPILSYCSITNLNIIKSIISSISQVKTQIESNKYICIFDNNAILNQQSQQQIILYDYNEEQSEWIYNKFSIFGIKERKFSIYIFSSEDAEYQITIADQAPLTCFSNCNNVGICSQSQPSFCVCNGNLFGTNCQISSLPYKANEQQIVTLESQKEVLISIPLNLNNTNSLDININANQKIDCFLACQFEKDYLPFHDSQFYDLNKIDNGKIPYSSEKVQECLSLFDEINQELGQQMAPLLLLLFYNKQATNVLITLSVDTKKNDHSDDRVIYYILAGAFASLILAFVLIGCALIYKRRNNKQFEQYSSDRRNSTEKSQKEGKFHERQFSGDFIPVELYEQVIQEYPGLNMITECQICLVEFDNQDLVKLTYCLHLFHQSCLDEWRKKLQICPVCRGDLTKQKYKERQKDQEIFQFGVIAGDDIQIDNKKIEEIIKREQRIKQLQLAQSSSVINTLKESSPSPSSGEPLKLKFQQKQQK
ncbi:unnamed protein product (macronuclear) [Paramecium tetraurelia]|uniref:RING-type domain-containing protein n=1 Tax=Paramecium tetraurelia TaxID=5888 RepID=A0D2R8_PARTE|nr:uncharacterized protein GSPATT00012843001 [Paramecium tetraurelia]CAK77335.1 unnamed protein product [Paramecium tetraurelia]|eukprot:XP_001444732.1 hypothetical protein (macronuclear) [Paramecium tetraurelia strain d4-2]